MEIYRRQEEVGYALILEATYSCPSALEVAMLYHKSQLAAVPPKPRSGKELLDIWDASFRGERVSLLEESIGKYNSWKVGDEAKLMIPVDRLKTLIQRLASLENVVTEASKSSEIKMVLNPQSINCWLSAWQCSHLILPSINLFQ
jgi:hypothetical protein